MDNEKTQQAQSAAWQSQSRMIEVIMNDGTIRLIPYNQIQVELKLPSGQKIDLQKTDQKFTPSECFLYTVGGQSFNLRGDYALNFLDSLVQQGLYQPTRVNVESPQHAGAGSHASR